MNPGRTITLCMLAFVTSAQALAQNGTRGNIFDDLGGKPADVSVEPPKFDRKRIDALYEELRRLQPEPIKPGSLLGDSKQDQVAYALLKRHLQLRMSEITRRVGAFKSMFVHALAAYQQSWAMKNDTDNIKAQVAASVVGVYQKKLAQAFTSIIESLHPERGHRLDAAYGFFDNEQNFAGGIERPLVWSHKIGFAFHLPKNAEVDIERLASCDDNPAAFRERVSKGIYEYETYFQINIGNPPPEKTSYGAGDRYEAEKLAMAEKRCGLIKMDSIGSDLLDVAKECGTPGCVLEVQAVAYEMVDAMVKLDKPFEFKAKAAQNFELIFDSSQSHLRNGLANYIRSKMTNSEENLIAMLALRASSPAYWALLAPVDLVRNLKVIKTGLDFTPDYFKGPKDHFWSPSANLAKRLRDKISKDYGELASKRIEAASPQ